MISENNAENQYKREARKQFLKERRYKDEPINADKSAKENKHLDQFGIYL